jgi:5,10-methylenetetrahydromethanopterin reductase
MDFGLGLKVDYDADTLARIVRHAEAHGFQNLWFPDERFFMDAFSLMCFSALSTNRIKLGTAVTDPFVRHPALTASISATVDVISNQRVVLGLGAGLAGFAQLGINRKKPATALREATDLIRRLQRGETVTKDGEVVKTHGCRLDFKPARQVPIYIAGRGEKILQLAGEVGDGVIIGALSSEVGLRYADQNIRKGIDAAGRRPGDVKKVLWIHTCISRDGAAAHKAIGGMMAYLIYSSPDVVTKLGVPAEVVSQIAEAVKTRLGGIPSYQGFRKLADLVPEEVADAFSLAGTPEQIRERLGFLEKKGIDQVAFNPYLQEGMAPEEFVKLLSSEVVEKLA